MRECSAARNIIIALINAPWADPVTETPRAGSVELWRIINTTGDAHPIHIHLESSSRFSTASRSTRYPGRLVFTGPRVVAPANERPAFKDTIKALPGEVFARHRRIRSPERDRDPPGPEIPLRLPLPHPGARGQ